MTDLRALVSELARIEEGPPIVTLYLDVHWRDEQQRERVRLFFRDGVRDAKLLFADRPKEWNELARTLANIEAWIEQSVNQDIYPDARGAILVASAERNLFIEGVFAESVDSAIYIDTRPRLFPLIELLSLERPAFVAAVDSSGAEILELKSGEIIDEHGVERGVPNRHKRGGWSQHHFQRHVKRVIEGVWKECAQLLTQLAVDTPNADLILLGQEMNLRGFEKLLPQALIDRIIGMRPIQGDRRKMLQVAKEVCDEERIARQFAVVHRILRQGLSDRSGTVGLEETLMAMNERRVKVLALSRRFNPPGFRCTNCDALWHTGAGGCVFCGGATVSALLREELTRRAVADGAELVIVPDGGPLDAYRGVGCLLRHLMSEERRQHPIGKVGQAEPTLMP